jgi:hypothetical protein
MERYDRPGWQGHRASRVKNAYRQRIALQTERARPYVEDGHNDPVLYFVMRVFILRSNVIGTALSDSSAEQATASPENCNRQMDVGEDIASFLLAKGLFKPPASCLRASVAHLRFAQLQGLGRHLPGCPMVSRYLSPPRVIEASFYGRCVSLADWSD